MTPFVYFYDAAGAWTGALDVHGGMSVQSNWPIGLLVLDIADGDEGPPMPETA